VPVTRRYSAERIGAGPIIRPDPNGRIGANVQGPSLIRVPEWVANPLGRYYLYFAHHNGDHIRLAYADALAGPWRIHEPGSLQHSESHFPPKIDPAPPGSIPPGFVEPTPHIASPDVHVDEQGREIRMYYHGILKDRPQATRVATSKDGVHFTAREEILGPSYFRVFEYAGMHYALAMPGLVLRSKDGLGGFERGPRLFANNMRHSAVLVDGDELVVFYTNGGEDPPERILVATIDLHPDWMDWAHSEPTEVLRPERDYEGANLPLVPSIRGESNVPVNQLRDPAVYVEDGELYLLYSVAGESGIGIARLVTSEHPRR
jgi:hypothetical protein